MLKIPVCPKLPNGKHTFKWKEVSMGKELACIACGYMYDYSEREVNE